MIVWCLFLFQEDDNWQEQKYLSIIFETESVAMEYVKKHDYKNYVIEDWFVLSEKVV